MTQQLQHKEIIRLAEEVGLLVKNKDIPYSSPAHMRFISRLEKFAVRVQEASTLTARVLELQSTDGK